MAYAYGPRTLYPRMYAGARTWSNGWMPTSHIALTMSHAMSTSNLSLFSMTLGPPPPESSSPGRVASLAAPLAVRCREAGFFGVPALFAEVWPRMAVTETGTIVYHAPADDLLHSSGGVGANVGRRGGPLDESSRAAACTTTDRDTHAQMHTPVHT